MKKEITIGFLQDVSSVFCSIGAHINQIRHSKTSSRRNTWVLITCYLEKTTSNVERILLRNILITQDCTGFTAKKWHVMESLACWSHSNRPHTRQAHVLYHNLQKFKCIVFVTIFVVTGGPLMPLQQDCANVLCALMLSSCLKHHVSPWIQELACKNTVQPSVDLWDVREQGQTFICKVLWHVSMNLCHCKAHLIEFQVIIPLDCQLILIVFQHSFQWWPHNPGSLLEVGILWVGTTWMEEILHILGCIKPST